MENELNKWIPEHVLCAANWYPDLRWPNPVDDLPSIYWLPQNIDRGVVFSGRHHLQCMYQCYQIFGVKQHEVNEQDDIFLMKPISV